MGRIGKQLTEKVRTSTPSLIKWYLFLTFYYIGILYRIESSVWKFIGRQGAEWCPDIKRGEFTPPPCADRVTNTVNAAQTARAVIDTHFRICYIIYR